MFRYLRREIQFIGQHIAVVAAAAFLCALGGIFLWINGGSSWYVIRTSGGTSPRMSIIFTVWVIAYALCGAAIAMIWLVYRTGKRAFCASIPWFSLAVMSYLFMLVWYAVFFCTRLVVFAAIVLIISCISDVLLFLFMRKTLLIFSVITVILFMIQAYFVWFTFAIS